MMPLGETVGLGAMDLLSGKKLQGAFMGANRFPVDIPRLVDFYLRGLLDLDSIVAYVQYARHPNNAGGWSLGRVGPIAEGLVAWWIGAALLVGMCVLIGTRLKT